MVTTAAFMLVLVDASHAIVLYARVPLQQFLRPRNLGVNREVRIITKIKLLAIVANNPRALDCDHVLSRRQIESLDGTGPCANLHEHAALVCDGDHALLLEQALLRVYLGLGTHIMDHTYHVDYAVPQLAVWHLLNLLQRHKVEALVLYREVVGDLLDLCVAVEDQTEVVLDRGVFRICEFNLSVREEVNLLMCRKQMLTQPSRMSESNLSTASLKKVAWIWVP